MHRSSFHADRFPLQYTVYAISEKQPLLHFTVSEWDLICNFAHYSKMYHTELAVYSSPTLQPTYFTASHTTAYLPY